MVFVSLFSYRFPKPRIRTTERKNKIKICKKKQQGLNGETKKERDLVVHAVLTSLTYRNASERGAAVEAIAAIAAAAIAAGMDQGSVCTSEDPYWKTERNE